MPEVAFRAGARQVSHVREHSARLEDEIGEAINYLQELEEEDNEEDEDDGSIDPNLEDK